MRDGTAEDLPVQHSWYLQIVDVLSSPRYLGLTLKPVDRAADLFSSEALDDSLQLFLDGCHCVSPRVNDERTERRARRVCTRTISRLYSEEPRTSPSGSTSEATRSAASSISASVRG